MISGLTTAWFYRHGRIHCGDTNLVVGCEMKDASSFELTLKPRQTADPLQLWQVEADGRISLQQRPELLWTSLTRKSKKSRSHGIALKRRETADPKLMQDQTFTVLVKLGINQVFFLFDARDMNEKSVWSLIAIGRHLPYFLFVVWHDYFLIFSIRNLPTPTCILRE